MYQNHIPDGKQLFIVSNRTPVSLEKDGLSITAGGGLVAGLSSAHSSTKSVWIGYCGESPGKQHQKVREQLLSEYRVISVPLEAAQYKKYYEGMANATIWPLCHYSPTLIEYRQDFWLAYEAVNAAFCQKIADVAQVGDYIWIHDYHLMLLPAMLREARPDLHIGYFHHIPFPSSEIFRTLPQRKTMLRGLLGADIVGFHTYDYVRHFLTCLTRILGEDVSLSQVQLPHRSVKVGAFPLGIDIERIKDATRTELFQQLERDLANLGTKDKTVLLGVDRLDHTKGIPQRLMAFGALLEKYPDLAKQVVFVQICVPSRENVRAYRQLKLEVERLVGEINGRYATPGHTPIQYLYRTFRPEEVYAFMRMADVAVVTPLRDGLNLVCKEFVACKGESPGTLILSEFAGASAELGEAILVNPYNIDELAQAMYKAIEMPVEQRHERMSASYRRVASYNNEAWFKEYMTTWSAVVDAVHAKSLPFDATAFVLLSSKLKSNKKLNIFLDYDGTLVPIARRPELALPSPQLKALLNEANTGLNLIIVSGRPRDFFDQHFPVNSCHMFAEYGAFFRERGQDKWHDLLSPASFEEVKSLCLETFRTFEARVPRSFTEIKERSLVFHYRESEQIYAKTQALELRELLDQSLNRTMYNATLGKRTVEVRSAICQKQEAVKYYLEKYAADDKDSEFICMGDEATDEAMYTVFPERNISFHVGKLSYHARYSVKSPEEALGIIAQFSRMLKDGIDRH